MCAAATNTAVAEVQALSSLHAPELKPAPEAVKKRGAIIGSAPQLNAQGLLAAAELAKEREAAKLKQVLIPYWLAVAGGQAASCRGILIRTVCGHQLSGPATPGTPVKGRANGRCMRGQSCDTACMVLSALGLGKGCLHVQRGVTAASCWDHAQLRLHRNAPLAYTTDALQC